MLLAHEGNAVSTMEKDAHTLDSTMVTADRNINDNTISDVCQASEFDSDSDELFSAAPVDGNATMTNLASIGNDLDVLYRTLCEHLYAIPFSADTPFKFDLQEFHVPEEVIPWAGKGGLIHSDAQPVFEDELDFCTRAREKFLKESGNENLLPLSQSTRYAGFLLCRMQEIDSMTEQQWATTGHHFLLSDDEAADYDAWSMASHDVEDPNEAEVEHDTGQP